MKIKFVYGILPVFIIEDKELRSNGSTRLMFIWLKDLINLATEAHELEHVKHNYQGLFIFSALLYSLCRPYRQWSEVEAYKAALKIRPDLLGEYAMRLIDPQYDLDLTYTEAMDLLKTE